MRISVRVIPNAHARSVQLGIDGSLKVHLMAPAKEGKANRELLELLADFYAVPRTSLRIVKGETSRSKIVEKLT